MPVSVGYKRSPHFCVCTEASILRWNNLPPQLPSLLSPQTTDVFTCSSTELQVELVKWKSRFENYLTKISTHLEGVLRLMLATLMVLECWSIGSQNELTGWMFYRYSWSPVNDSNLVIPLYPVVEFSLLWFVFCTVTMMFLR